MSCSNGSIDSPFKKVNIVAVTLQENFVIAPYLRWFSQKTQNTILSYRNYYDQLLAFTSQLLQQYYLSSLLNKHPNQLDIHYTQHNKPYLVELVNSMDFEIKKCNNPIKPIKYNVSHCYNYVVLGVYRGDDYEIGVDIEKIDYHKSSEIVDMSKIVFSESEQKLINGSVSNFFKLWTKKEALIKAIGTGFVTDFYQSTQINLDDVEITEGYSIITQQISDYFLSVCLSNYKSSYA